MKLGLSIVLMAAHWVVGCGAETKIRGDANAPGEPALASSPAAPTGEASAGDRDAPKAARASVKPDRANDLAAQAIDDRFTVTRQVNALERAIELYQTFIER